MSEEEIVESTENIEIPEASPVEEHGQHDAEATAHFEDVFAPIPESDPDIAVGGQAVLEGVMMRGPKAYAVAVRHPDGHIVVHRKPFIPVTKRRKLLGLPIIRGAVSLIEMMMLGYRTLEYSANIAESASQQRIEEKKKAKEAAKNPDSDMAPEAETAETPKTEIEESFTGTIENLEQAASFPPVGPEEGTAAVGETQEDFPEPEKALTGFQMFTLFAMGMGLAMLLFVVLPNVATQFIGMLFHVEGSSGQGFVEVDYPISYNLIAGLIRVMVMVAYIWGISFIPDIKRLFMYHGAEHKVVMAYEQKIPLEIENIRPVTTLHPRCGTTFIAIVIGVSIIAFALLAAVITAFFPEFKELSIWIRKPIIILLHIVCMPLVGGIAYEFTRRAGKNPDFWLYKMLLAPGFAFQHITTREPDDDMIEVSLTSFRAAMREG
ncbi:MAG: DUF1385 domain-containing protein [Candidatus Sumerlaeota bacterium]